MVVVTPEGVGLVADEEFAAKLSVPMLVMMPNVRGIIAKPE